MLNTIYYYISETFNYSDLLPAAVAESAGAPLGVA